MTDRKECIRCHRQIDAGARICPFCNWDQLETPPQVVPRVETAPVAARPPVRERVRQVKSNRSLVLAALAVLLIAAFAVGGLFFALGSRSETPRPRITAESSPTGPDATSTSPSDLPLVTGTSPAPAVTTEAPLTTLPANVGVAGTTGTTGDATALSSVDYSRMTQTAAPPQYRPVDPRSVTVPPPGSDAATARRTPPPQQTPPPAEEEPRPDRVSKRTSPRPISQPIPNIRNAEGTVRLKLTVSPNGRVTAIDVLQPIAGATDKIIAAVQHWKFEPATVDGEPVEGTFTVEIFFGGNGR